MVYPSFLIELKVRETIILTISKGDHNVSYTMVPETVFLKVKVSILSFLLFAILFC